MQHLRFRTQIALVSALGGAFTLAPAPLDAQAPVERPSTHTVKRGDTLWDLAQQYLGDPFQWPQVYRLNTDIIKDPHWIYPNQVFKLPGGTMGTDQVAPAAGTGVGTGLGAAPQRRGNMTVFNPAMYTQRAQARTSLMATVRRTAVRRGDYASAPFIWSEGGPTDGGRLDGTAETGGVTMTLELRPLQFREDAFITMPRGVDATPGLKLLIYRLDALIPGQGQVVVPTGVVIVRAAVAGGRARATLTEKFEDVFAGSGAMVLDTLVMPTNVFPTRVAFGLATKVTWIYANPQLAGPGGTLVLDAGIAEGLVSGDQVSLRRARGSDAAGLLPDEEIGIAQITRVTPWGASAMILESSDVGITPGMRAQVSAKMP